MPAGGGAEGIQLSDLRPTGLRDQRAPQVPRGTGASGFRGQVRPVRVAMQEPTRVEPPPYDEALRQDLGQQQQPKPA